MISAKWTLKRVNLKDGRSYKINVKTPTTIGRDPYCDIWCDSIHISRIHAAIIIEQYTNQICLSDSVSNFAINC